MKPDPSLVIESADIVEAEVQVYGNVALVTSLNSFMVKTNGRVLEGKFLSLTIWVNNGENWQCVKAAIYFSFPLFCIGFWMAWSSIEQVSFPWNLLYMVEGVSLMLPAVVTIRLWRHLKWGGKWFF